MDDVVRAYLVLALRLDRLRPGSVSAYTGDPALAAAVADEPRPTAAALVRAAGRLRDALPAAGLAPARERFLAGQLMACEWVARRLAGQRVGFVSEVAATFDTPVALGAEDTYRAAHREIAALLPGQGPLADRWAAHRHRDAVPPTALVTAAAVLLSALRERTRAAGLVAGAEDVELGTVAAAPWAALHRRAATGRSRVVLNAGGPVRRARLPRLLAHECYPGHHVEQCRRDSVLVADRGWDEHRVVLTCSPQATVSEGAAELGLDVVVGRGWGPWAASVLGGIGLGLDGELAERLDLAAAPLSRVRLDAALLLHDRRARPAEVAEYLRRWLLVDDAGAARVLAGLGHPVWRAYSATYVEGAALVRRWLTRPGDGSAAERFADLLVEPWTPSTLRAQLFTQSAPNEHERRQAVFVKR